MVLVQRILEAVDVTHVGNDSVYAYGLRYLTPSCNAPGVVRTRDLSLKRRLLSRLSYGGKWPPKLVLSLHR